MDWPSLGATAYIAGQLLRLNGAVGNEDPPTTLSRYSGGQNRTNQPHITGYHHVLFYLPETLFGPYGSEAQRWLFSTCETFSPHSYTINTGDVLGIGQTAASFPTSRVTNREFTLGFREQQNLPILSIIKSWHSLFDPLIGTSPFGSFVLSPLAYKAIVIVAIVKPTSSGGKITSDDLEEAYVYSGVYPTTCPEDSVVASEQSTNDTSLASVTFKFDGAPFDLGTIGVAEAVVFCFDNYKYTDTYSKIGSLIKS
jgi:hypothetical protein